MSKSAGHILRHADLWRRLHRALDRRAVRQKYYKHAQSAGDALRASECAADILRAEREIGQILTEAQKRKDVWIENARRRFNPGRREACYVCGKFAAVTQAHHVIPLADQYDQEFEEPNQEFVWLCPTHHAAVQVLVGPHDDAASRGRAAAAIICDLAEGDEYHAMLRLLGWAGRHE